MGFPLYRKKKMSKFEEGGGVIYRRSSPGKNGRGLKGVGGKKRISCERKKKKKHCEHPPYDQGGASPLRKENQQGLSITEGSSRERHSSRGKRLKRLREKGMSSAFKGLANEGETGNPRKKNQSERLMKD